MCCKYFELYCVLLYAIPSPEFEESKFLILSCIGLDVPGLQFTTSSLVEIPVIENTRSFALNIAYKCTYAIFHSEKRTPTE